MIFNEFPPEPEKHFPDNILPLWEGLREELISLYMKWIVLKQLFSSSPERVKLLNDCGSSLFFILQHGFVHLIILGLGNLAAPEKFRKDWRLSFATLLLKLRGSVDQDFHASLTSKQQQFVELWKNLKPIRDSKIAHFDLEAKIHPTPTLLPELTVGDIEKTLDAAQDFMNFVEKYFINSTTAYSHVSMDGDGDDLVEVIARGFRYEEILISHQIPNDDFHKSPYAKLFVR